MDLFDWGDGRREPPDYPLGVPTDVAALFEELALELIRAGWARYSARAILHRIRWHRHVERGDRSFKANNNWTPTLSRWFMAKHPEAGDFFETRLQTMVLGEEDEAA